MIILRLILLWSNTDIDIFVGRSFVVNYNLIVNFSESVDFDKIEKSRKNGK